MTVPAWRSLGVVFLLALTLAILLQRASGADRVEFSGDDEAAHYVTGTMVGDFLASGYWSEPMKFAQRYYDRFPKVALGHWPPFLYAKLGGWQFLFGSGRESTLVLWAVFGAGVATAFAAMAAQEFGALGGAAAGLLLLLTVHFQRFVGIVMAEVPLALWLVLACAAFCRLYDSGRLTDGVLFGVASSLAILTKANGFALALVPPLAILIGRRFDLLRKPGLWVSAGICALTLPWYYFTRASAVDGWEGSSNPVWIAVHVGWVNLKYLARCAGPTAFVLALVGGAAALVHREYRKAIWSVPAAAVLSLLAFHTVIAPTREARHFIYAAPFVLLFAGNGWRFLLGRLPAAAARGFGTAALLILFLRDAGLPPAKPDYGATPAVKTFLQTQGGQGNLLVSSAYRGEGAFIAEAVRNESRAARLDGHYRILRATKVLLAKSSWDGSRSEARYQTPAEVEAALRERRIRWIAVDRHTDEAYPFLLPHHRLLERTIAANPASFRRVAPGETGSFDLYEFQAASGRGHGF